MAERNRSCERHRRLPPLPPPPNFGYRVKGRRDDAWSEGLETWLLGKEESEDIEMSVIVINCGALV